MTEALLALVPHYGAALVGLATFLSCLALPIPASLIMLAGGAFSASGDLSTPAVIGAALAGAVAGDLTGYAAGRFAAPRWDRLSRRPGAARMLGRAEASLRARDLMAVYLSRWLFSPLGPYVNLAAGAMRMGARRFLAADLAGEATWVAVYVGLGHAFAGQIEQIASLSGNAAGALAAGVVALVLGRMLWRAAQDPA